MRHLFTSKIDPAKQKAMNKHVENHLVQKLYVNCSIILGYKAFGWKTSDSISYIGVPKIFLLYYGIYTYIYIYIYLNVFMDAVNSFYKLIKKKKN